MITAKLRMRRTVEALVATAGGGLGRARRAGGGGGEVVWLILGTLSVVQALVFVWLCCGRVGPAVRINSESVYTV
jgi:hypothetical protein